MRPTSTKSHQHQASGPHQLVNAEQAEPDKILEQLESMRNNASAISKDEYFSRIAQLTGLLKENNCAAIFLHAGVNLYYFTGVQWSASERLCGAVIDAEGKIHYVVPCFETGTFEQQIVINAPFITWQEHENPFALLADFILEQFKADAQIALDGILPYSMAESLRKNLKMMSLCDGSEMTQFCRMRKSDNEIALIQLAMDITLKVQNLVKRILRPGITADEVKEFIDKAHRKLGADNGSYFCIVLFGADTAFPHGVKQPKTLQQGDVVLVDTGCRLHGYHSDITRSYVFETQDDPKLADRQKEIWHIENEAQVAAFDAAKPGTPCEQVDARARSVLERYGLGPGYKAPGLIHRTGHGLGLEIHEPPYIVGGNKQTLEKGMVFSIEPMICVPGEFGIRLEDIVYIDEKGANWFTAPECHNIVSENV